MKKRHLNKKHILLIAVMVISIFIWVLYKYEIWNFISIDYLRKFTDKIQALGWLGLLLYLLSFAIGTMLFLPSVPFALLGGITYGTVQGITYAVAGDLLGASMAFIIARYIGRERIEKRLRKSKAFHEIDEGVKQDGWRIVVLTRMVPVIPHWLQNYAYGLTSISFTTYAFVSLLCIIPGTAVWIFAVNTVGRGQEDAKRTMIYLGIASVLIIAVSYLPKWIYKKKRQGSK
ncbi:SNARE associated Golgi protein [Alkaliphilus metalliredigens QYMF]|uniref:TVP38/TMEM64 family membrane protein n=1 Tax=Alkaliphilus metalliredigens (strain QYMF) TaxID=293826 RepID=A6TMR1_ALKMQ|nr:VTT domain-containing protein [Alkaliphilus metalliredigens]ABR47479.1 SNARE associated Golgi protein [Alkaliphilus metalliredigens QYMF]